MVLLFSQGRKYPSSVTGSTYDHNARPGHPKLLLYGDAAARNASTGAPPSDDEGSSVPALGSLMLLGRERAPRRQACAKDGDQTFGWHG